MPPIAATRVLSLSGLEPLLRNLESSIDNYLIKIKADHPDAEIDPDELELILNQHSERFREISTKTLLPSNFSPSNINREARRKPTNRSSTKPLEEPEKKLIRVKWGGFKPRSTTDSESDGGIEPMRNPNRISSSTSLKQKPDSPSGNFPVQSNIEDTYKGSSTPTIVNSRGAVGGASKLFGRGNSKPFTPIKTKNNKSAVVDLTSDSEHAEAEEDLDDSLLYGDIEKIGDDSRRTRKGDSRSHNTSAHEAAKKRTLKSLSQLQNTGDKKSTKDDVPSSSKRRLENSHESDDDTNPSSKKRKAEGGLWDSSYGNRKQQRERDASLGASESDRTKAIERSMNSHKSPEIINLASDSDNDNIKPSQSSSFSSNFNGKRKSGSGLIEKTSNTFISPHDRDKEYGWVDREDTSPTPTPSHTAKMPSISLLHDKVVGGFRADSVDAGSDSAAEMENEVWKDTEREDQNDEESLFVS